MNRQLITKVRRFLINLTVYILLLSALGGLLGCGSPSPPGTVGGDSRPAAVPTALPAAGVDPVLAWPSAPETGVMLRDVLALYDSAEGATEIDNNIRLNAEMPLNFLGLRVVYRDVASGLPSPAEMARFRGIVTWWETPRMRNAEAWWQWLGDNLRAGRRVIILNELGPLIESQTNSPVPLRLVNRTLALLGLEAGMRRSDFSLDIALDRQDTAMTEFERPLGYEIARFSELASRDTANQVWLSLRHLPTGARGDVVVMTPKGGVAVAGYQNHMDPEDFRREWRIDPFRFFSRSLGVEHTPRLDCTTRNGARLFFSHVDGDGVSSISRLDRRSLCGEVLRDSVFQALPDLPFTVSVIATEVDPATRGTPRVIECARTIFALPNVEAASHTFSHPLIWNLSLVSRLQVTEYTVDIDTATRRKEGAILAYRLPHYQYNPEQETIGSAAIINRLLPPGKLCRMLLWSGNCLPDAPALAACAKGGLGNLNGGDSRFDAEYPSYAHLASLYRQVGPWFQVHAAAANENLYTRLWTDFFGGYQNVIQTFLRTESPRRVAPINIYYHHYSAERAPASLNAVLFAYAWARQQSIFPVFASRYVEIVKGFIAGRIEPRGDNAWRITGNGECRTVRFDDCRLVPDLARSQGLLGFNFHQGALYVFLDDSPDHLIVLAASPPEKPYLHQATAEVKGLAYDRTGGFRFSSNGWGEARYVWRNLTPNRRWRVTVAGPPTSGSSLVTSDSEGVCSFTCRPGAAARVEVRPET